MTTSDDPAPPSRSQRTDAEEGLEATTQPIPSPSSPTVRETEREETDIFISYRVRPDEPLAQALKNLLESACEPTPKVFVSGLGGIRPSGDSPREQIRNAANEAKAFFGIITHSSKEREWVFFEAGAAFGRRVAYVPVLFDLEFSELGSTIGGFQALQHSDKPGLRRAIDEIAKAIRCTPAAHFGSRYNAFLRAARNCRLAQISLDSPNPSSLEEAAHLADNGETEAAVRAFEECINTAEDDDQKCFASISKELYCGPPRRDFAAFLDELHPDLKATATWAFWAAENEIRPVQRLSLRRRVISAPAGAVRDQWIASSLRDLLQFQHSPSAVSEAETHLLERLRGTVQQRANAALVLVQSHATLSTAAKLLIASPSLQRGQAELYFETARLAHELGREAEYVYLSKLAADGGRGDYANDYGIALSKANLDDLAFMAFERAAEAEATVALENMANMVGYDKSIPMALSILKRQEDIFSSDPGRAFEMRAQFERSIEKEKKRLRELFGCARDCLRAFAALGEMGIRGSVTPRKDASLTRRGSPSLKLSWVDDKLLLDEAELVPIELLSATYTDSLTAPRTFVGFDVDRWRAVRLPSEVDGSIAWYEGPVTPGRE